MSRWKIGRHSIDSWYKLNNIWPRLKLATLGATWCSQITRSPKFTFWLRMFFYEGEWEDVVSGTMELIKTADQLLSQFYSQRFISTQVTYRIQKLETAFKELLGRTIPEHYRSNLVANCRMDPKASVSRVQAALEVFNTDISEIEDGTDAFQRLENCLAENQGRSLKLIQMETYFQVIVKSFYAG